MKKFLSIAFGLICCAAAVLACFDDDPFSNLSNHGTTITGGGGSNTGINLPGDLFPVEKFPDEDRNNSYAMVIETAFPCTLSVNFSGFIDADGNEVTEPITRMCVLYFSTAGKWVILKDIRNPQYRIISTADEKACSVRPSHHPVANGIRQRANYTDHAVFQQRELQQFRFVGGSEITVENSIAEHGYWPGFNG